MWPVRCADGAAGAVVPRLSFRAVEERAPRVGVVGSDDARPFLVPLHLCGCVVQRGRVVADSWGLILSILNELLARFVETPERLEALSEEVDDVEDDS